MSNFGELRNLDSRHHPHYILEIYYQEDESYYPYYYVTNLKTNKLTSHMIRPWRQHIKINIISNLKQTKNKEKLE